MQNLNNLADSNRLLNTPEKIAVYTILYTAKARGTQLSIQQIKESAKAQYNIDIDYYKTSRIIDTFQEECIISEGATYPKTYHLINTIYVPFNHSPIPAYQLSLLLAGALGTAYVASFTTDTVTKIAVISSFVTILSIVSIHYLIFELANSPKFTNISLTGLHSFCLHKLKKLYKSELFSRLHIH